MIAAPRPSARPSDLVSRRAQCGLLVGAVLVALAVRVPGVFWGYNFPPGWHGHHPDEYTHLVYAEMMIDPQQPPRWWPLPYPKGMAAHVAAPLLGLRTVGGELEAPLPSPETIIVLGRSINVVYGVASIVVVYALARRLFRDLRIALLSAWLMALGGLHVTQSHFFLADVPSLFWFLLGSLLLLLDLDPRNVGRHAFLRVAAFCLGISFGIKLSVFGLASLTIVALMRRPRAQRLLEAGVLFLAGLTVVNLSIRAGWDLARILKNGSNDGFQFSWLANTLLYVIELPSIVSFPLAVLSIVGSVLLARQIASRRPGRDLLPILVVIIMPICMNLGLVVVMLDHFARHLVPLIPWIALISAWALVRTSDRLGLNRFGPAVVIGPMLLYLAVFVVDGERVFIQEPRNDAARWISENVPAGEGLYWVYHSEFPGYRFVDFPAEGRPSVVVMEMLDANHYLSGMGPKNSYPADTRMIFRGRREARVRAFQEVFQGRSEYREVARFDEGYLMPEYRLVNDLLGDRSRSYVTEVVIFATAAVHASEGGEKGPRTAR